MKSIRSDEFTQDIAVKDIDYCLQNANSKGYLEPNGKYFIRNPHMYLNGSDNVIYPVSTTIKEGDRVLAIGASGDYMLDSILYGANEVVNYDINDIQYYACCLKVWAIQTLEYEEFINFFTNFLDTKNYLDHKTFEKIIAPFKDEPAAPFWKRFARRRRIETNAIRYTIDDLAALGIDLNGLPEAERNYAICAKLGPEIHPETFNAMRLIVIPNAARESFGYLSCEENYKKVQDRIKDVELSFVTSSVEDIRTKLPEDKKFNMIFLSNVPFYLDTDNFVGSVTSQLMPLLEEDGAISVYHQGMRISWFNRKLDDRNFVLSKDAKKDFDQKDGLYNINIHGIEQLLDAHVKLVNKGLDINMTEIPTYGGATGVNVESDIVYLVKKR